MPNKAAKIAGPMLRTYDEKGNPRSPAKPISVVVALTQARIHSAVVREWENEAKRKNKMPGSEELRGRTFRAHQETRRRGAYVTKAPVKPLSWRQRLARRITRLFRR